MHIFKEIKQEEVEVLISNSNKPRAFSNISYPLNDLDDRIFEVLTYSVFKKRLASGDKILSKKYDDIVLMQGVGEKGIDCFFKKNGKINSVIQCKKYSKNLTDTLILTELIKFCLHLIIDDSKFDLTKKFTYYIATSTGFTGKANILCATFNGKNPVKNYNIEDLTNSVLSKFKEFKQLSYELVESKLLKLIKCFNYEQIGPEDYNLWINDYKDIIYTFFDIRKVTDNSLIEEKSVEIISKIDKIGPETLDYEKFFSQYTSVAIEKLNVVNFIGFDIQRHRQRPEDITLTDLFVQPSFLQRSKDKNEKVNSVLDKELKLTNLLKSEKNIVILGDPGAGKSLLVKFLVVSLLQKQSEKFGLRQLTNHIPFRIELRKYNEKRDSKNIIEYLSEHLINEYQVNISSRNLETLFENFPSLVFFDGLDEIFNINHKTKVKEAVEVFSSRFPLAKCVVTSRFIGYHDIKFNPKKFDEFGIVRFNQTQIRELVTKFYNSQNGSVEKRRILIESCLKQINDDVDEELKSNPLILTLILILASNNIIIPDSKLEIYESCTKTLVDSIDVNDKNLNFDIPVSNKNFTFCKLAHWQYVSQSDDKEVNFDKAKNEIANFLFERKECDDIDDALSKAEKFLDYAERRSIYFENNFTHKTFLEYYTAEFLYSTCIAKASDNGRKKLLDVVSKYLSSSFWYIVFELLFTRIDNFQPDNELLDEIFLSQIQGNSLDVFYFLISNLAKFKNVSKSVQKKIIYNTISLCIKGEKLKNTLKRSMIFEENNIVHKLYVLQANKTFFDLTQEVIYELENDDKLGEKQLIELYNLYFEIHSSTSIGRRARHNNKLKINNKEKLNELASKDLLLYSHLNFDGYSRDRRVPIEILINQIESFGHKSLFTHIPLRYSNYSQRIDTFDLYLMNAIENGDASILENELNKLTEFGLRHELIINHVKSNKVYYFIRSENLDKLLKIYLKSESKKIDEIVVSLISRADTKMNVAYQKFKAENAHNKLRVIDKIFEKNKPITFHQKGNTKPVR